MSSVDFTEEMKGYVTLGETDFEKGAKQGRKDGTFLMFHLTISTGDIDVFVIDKRKEGVAEGWIECEALGGKLPVEKGIFNLFVESEETGVKNMLYRLFFADGAGNPLTLTGFKVIRDDPGDDLWSDTTTLYTRILKGHVDAAGEKAAGEEAAEIVASGIITIWLKDFAKQLTTFRGHGDGPAEQADAVTRFGKLFMGELWEVYGPHRRRYPADALQPRDEARELRLPEPEVHPVTTSDNVELRLTRYKGGAKGPVILAPGFGTSTLALATETVDTNFPEYLYERGYDVWLLDYRSSPVLPSAATQYTVDDIATRDWPAAIDTVRSSVGVSDVQVVAHCVASMSLNMGLAAGVKGVRSFISSQVALTPKVVPLVRIKAALRLASVLRFIGARTLTTDYHGDMLGDRVLDKAMRLWPTREKCESPVCRRILFMYGEVFRHEQLNEATHQAVHNMFGVANLTFFRHMSKITARGQVMDAQGEDVYLANVGNMTVPITYIHGEFNNFFPPVGTKLTYQLLAKANGPDLYRRLVFPNYAHMDTFLGKNAARDIFPSLHLELERYN